MTLSRVWARLAQKSWNQGVYVNEPKRRSLCCVGSVRVRDHNTGRHRRCGPDRYGIGSLHVIWSTRHYQGDSCQDYPTAGGFALAQETRGGFLLGVRKPTALGARIVNTTITRGLSSGVDSFGSNEEPKYSHVKMPEITPDDKFGDLTSWSVEVGDRVEVGDVICEVELELFSIGVKIETSGYIAELLVSSGTKNVPVGAAIATVVESLELVQSFQAVKEAQTPVNETGFTWKDILKSVHRLLELERINEDEASELMGLARTKDADLMMAFSGSFEGDEFKEEEFDSEIFLIQAKSIIKKRRGLDSVKVATGETSLEPDNGSKDEKA